MEKLRQIVLAFFLCVVCHAQAQLRVPAFTAYLEPDPDGAQRFAGVRGFPTGRIQR